MEPDEHADEGASAAETSQAIHLRERLTFSVHSYASAKGGTPAEYQELCQSRRPLGAVGAFPRCATKDNLGRERLFVDGGDPTHGRLQRRHLLGAQLGQELIPDPP